MKIVLFFIPLFFLACTTPNNKELIVNKKHSAARSPQNDELELYRNEVIESFKSEGLPIPTISMHPGSYHLSLTFGKITQAQFNLLLQNFKFPGLDQAYLPIYNANKIYQLLDFMPPKIQALSNKRIFGNFTTPFPDWFQKYIPGFTGDTQEYFINDTNCWGTVHDILLSQRYPQTVILFNYDKITDYFKTPQAFSKINDPNELRPYDVILYYDEYSETKEVTHASIYLGYGLIYEKEGLSEMDHYRIFYYKSGRTSREYYRPISGVPIKTAEELYGFSQTNPKMSSNLSSELKDPAKLSFFNSLIFIPRGEGVAQNFFISTSLRMSLKKDSTTQRYFFVGSEYPGTEIIDPVPKKFIEDY